MEVTAEDEEAVVQEGVLEGGVEGGGVEGEDAGEGVEGVEGEDVGAQGEGQDGDEEGGGLQAHMVHQPKNFSGNSVFTPFLTVNNQ